MQTLIVKGQLISLFNWEEPPPLAPPFRPPCLLLHISRTFRNRLGHYTATSKIVALQCSFCCEWTTTRRKISEACFLGRLCFAMLYALLVLLSATTTIENLLFFVSFSRRCCLLCTFFFMCHGGESACRMIIVLHENDHRSRGGMPLSVSTLS